MNKTNKKGFTLAELLIVVAIIAVLVAIAIPVFTAHLEKSREAVDAANIRAAYAEVMAEAITDGTKDVTKDVKLKQQTVKWQNSFDFPENLEEAAGAVEPDNGVTATIKWDKATEKVTISIKKVSA